MGRTVEEIKAELKKKRECLDALYLHQRTKGDKLPNGQSAFDYALKYNQSIKALKAELEQAEALPDDEVIAIARGEIYMTEEEKKRRQIDEKEVRSVLGIEEPDEDITRMAKKGW